MTHFEPILLPCFGGPRDGSGIAGTGEVMVLRGHAGCYVWCWENDRYEWRSELCLDFPPNTLTE